MDGWWLTYERSDSGRQYAIFSPALHPDEFLTGMIEGKLTDEMRAFVVQSLACFESPSTVADDVAREFGIEITRQSIQGYDPTTVAGAKLSERWRSLFTETRKAFLANTADIGISHRVVRLRALERLITKAEAQDDLGLVAKVLEQAARECGDSYTNKQGVKLNVLEDEATARRRDQLMQSIRNTMDNIRAREKRIEEFTRRASEQGIEI